MLFVIGLKFKGVAPPTEVVQQLLGKFTEKKNHEGSKKPQHFLSERIKDKIRLHLLVLCLFIDELVVEFADIQRDLKITTTK